MPHVFVSVPLEIDLHFQSEDIFLFWCICESLKGRSSLPVYKVVNLHRTLPLPGAIENCLNWQENMVDPLDCHHPPTPSHSTFNYRNVRVVKYLLLQLVPAATNVHTARMFCFVFGTPSSAHTSLISERFSKTAEDHPLRRGRCIFNFLLQIRLPHAFLKISDKGKVCSSGAEFSELYLKNKSSVSFVNLKKENDSHVWEP